MNNKEKYTNFWRTINLLNVSLFKNPRTYVIGFLLPMCLSILLEYLWTRYSNLEVTPPEMLSFIYVSVMCSTFYIGIFASEIRSNKFRTKINIKIKNWNILKSAMVLVIIEVTSIDLFFDTILFFIISRFNVAGFAPLLFDNLMAFVWIYYVIFGIMLGVMLGTIFLLIDGLFNKKMWSLLLMSIVFLAVLCFSDTIIPSRIVSNNVPMTIIGYFNPIKFVTWSMNLISSYQFQDKLGANQIYIQKSGSFEPFNRLWQTTVPAIIWLIIFELFYSFRKEKE